jgi:hypothetical protein
MGRPSDYTSELAADICARLANGEPLTSICVGEDMPGLSTVYRWLAADAVFRDMYARAREDQADTLADEIVKIADTEDDPAKARVRVDARKWVAAKLKPKKYGDKVDHTLGSDPDKPLITKVVREVIDHPKPADS